MSARVRLVGWEVAPVIMLDDGETLTPIPVEPRTITAAGWAEFKDGGDDRALSRLREQVEHSQPDTDVKDAPEAANALVRDAEAAANDNPDNL